MSLATAALLAAIGAGLEVLSQLVTLLPVLLHLNVSNAIEVLVFIGSAVAWTVFFAVFYRDQCGWSSPISLRSAAVLTLTLGIVPNALLLAVRLSAIIAIKWTGVLLFVLSWAKLGAWAVFLFHFAFGITKPPLATMATLLVGLTAAGSLTDAYEAVYMIRSVVNGTVAVFWNYNPVSSVWRFFIAPMIPVFYAAAQIMFFQAIARKPLPARILELQ
jgi:hypothetical protein